MAKAFGELSIVKKVSAKTDFTCVAYVDKGSKIVAGNTDGLIRVYDSEGLQQTAVLGTPVENADEATIPVTDITSLPPRTERLHSYFLSTYTNGFVKLWNTEKKVAVTTLNEGRQTLGLSFSPIQPYFVTVGDDAIIYLYDEETMSVVQTLRSSQSQGRVDGHSSRIFSGVFHPMNPNELISGGWDNTIQFWDVRKQTSVRYVTGPHVCGRSIDFIPGSGKEFITGSYAKENPLQKWDYTTGKHLVNFEADIFRCMLYCCRWISPDFLATGGTDPSLLRIMHLASNSTIGYFRSQQTGIYAMDVKLLHAGPKSDVDAAVPEKKVSMPSIKKKIEYESPVVRIAICTGRFILELDANLINR